MKIRPFTLSLAVLPLVFLAPLDMQAQSAGLPSQLDMNSAIESLRADIHADKVAIIRTTMQFTPQESDAFWPIYKKYAFDMDKVNDDRVAIVRQYAENYGTLTDTDSKMLVSKMLAYDQRRLDVKKKYFKAFSNKLSGQAVAKFFQLEHRLDLVIDLELASRLPSLLEKSTNQ